MTMQHGMSCSRVLCDDPHNSCRARRDTVERPDAVERRIDAVERRRDVTAQNVMTYCGTTPLLL